MRKTAHRLRRWRPALMSLLLIPLLLSVGCGSAHCYLWEVCSPTTSVYLLGSIHVAKPDLYPLDPAIEHAYEVSDAIAVEVDLDDSTEQKAAMLMIKYGMYTEGRTLEDDLKPETLQALRRYLRSKGLELDAVSTLKPWLLGEMLVLQQAETRGYRVALGIDKYFADRARGKKPILELETIESQLELLAGLDLQAQDLLLHETLNSLSEVDKQLGRIADAWERGDTDAIDRMLRQDWPEHRAVARWRKALLEDRNVQMASRIQTWLDGDKTIMVIVGSAHLAGKDSILSRLHHADYTIRQIPQASGRSVTVSGQTQEFPHDR